MINPYLRSQYIKPQGFFYAYNEVLGINKYKNIIIDLYFIDIPELAKSLPLNVA
jgi:hypothetical protein